MTDRCSYFFVVGKDHVGPAQVNAVAMVKSVLHATQAGERRILAILERDMSAEEFESVEATIRLLSFVNGIEDAEPVLESTDVAMRTQLQSAIAALEPSLSESGTVADFVRAYRQWHALLGEVGDVLRPPAGD